MASSVSPAAHFNGYPCICLPRALRPSPLSPLPAHCRVHGRFHTTNDTSAHTCHHHISPSAARAEASFVSSRPRPEVLSPAGGWHQLYAAVENGADAVYFGLTHFNARARASNFSPEELPEVMGYLHARGVKGYLVMNVLVFDTELEMIARYAQAAAAAGVDAVICQDIGVIRLIKAVIPTGLPVHGSTQMTITSAPGALFVKQRLGVDRVVLGRELSVKEIEAVAAQCLSSPMGPELEVFVHGALCVSYSGQCFSSEAWGGRSANRGQCAQACRLEYGLLVDGTLRDLGDVRYLLSPQDLAALDHVVQLMPLVHSFKIEGRLKGPEYVAMTTKAYRDAVDKAVEGPFKAEKETWRDLAQVFARGQDGDHLGLTPGFLQGPQHQKLVRGRAPRHRGLFLGKVTCLEFDRPTKLQSALITSTKILIEADLVNPLRRGDGIVVDIDMNDGSGDSRVPKEIGGFVQKIYCSKEVGGLREVQEAQGEGRVRIEVRLAEPISVKDREVANKGIHFKNKSKKKINESKLLREGVMLLWKTKDHALEAKLKSTYLNLPSTAKRRIPVRVRLEASLGQALRIYILEEREDGNLQSLETAETDVVAVKALSCPLSPKGLEAAVGTHLEHGEMGGGLVVRSWDHSGVEYDQELFLPVASIKDARRRAVDQFFGAKGLVARAPKDVPLKNTRNDPFSFNLHDYIVDPRAVDDSAAVGLSQETKRLSNFRSNSEPLLRVLCRTKAQVDAAVTIPWLEEIIVDFLEVHGLRSACDTVKAAGKRLVVATPRIVKPDEDSMFMNLYTRLGADAILVRSLGLLQLLLGASGHDGNLRVVLEGDFSLNAANSLSADALLGMGLDRIALTHDCNVSQLTQVARNLGDVRAFNSLEVIIHQNLPVFHTEHCVFARFLSSGNSYLDCGKPCERHTVHLRDGKGTDHLVLADMGCRNTVFEGRAQSGLHYVGDLVTLGFGCFRIELVDQPASVVVPLLQGYRQALLGHASPKKRRRQTEEGIIETDFSNSFWKWLENMPDSNGRTHGVGGGSLEPYAEREVENLKPTAASLKAVQSQPNVFSHQERGGRRKG